MGKSNHSQQEVVRKLSGYLMSLKRSWNVVVYDQQTNRRAVGKGLGETYAKMAAKGKVEKPVAIEYRAWKKLRHDQKAHR